MRLMGIFMAFLGMLAVFLAAGIGLTLARGDRVAARDEPLPSISVAREDPRLTGSVARVAVINYHHLDPGLDNPYTITPERLEHDLRWFLENGWAPLTLQEFRDWMEGSFTPVRDSFLLTFDDGYASFAEHALPVLQRLGVPATVFLITDDLGPTPREKGAPKLLPEQVAELVRSPLVSFGSHTHALHHLVNTGTGTAPAVFSLTPEALKADLDASIRRMEQMGVPPVALAWPYGRAPDWAVKTAAERFALIFTGEEGFVVRGERAAIRRFAMEFRTREHLQRQFGRPGNNKAAS